MLRNLESKIRGAKNFKYEEFIFSITAIRKGMVNSPSEEQWKSIEALAVNVLQPLRNHFGRIRIQSGFRCRQLNETVGGSKFSNHMRGEAADIVPLRSNISLADVVRYTAKNLQFRNIILEFSHWVHVDYREGANPCKIKIKDSNHDYSQVTLEYLEDYWKDRNEI